MPAPISVIIPTLNCAHQIGPTLASLYHGVSCSLVKELIIVDGGSTDDIEHISREIGAQFIVSNMGRGTQLATGAKAATGSWLFFVHADTVLPDNWPKAVAHHINEHKTAAYCKLSFDAHGIAPRIVAQLANIRAKLFGLPYGDQTLLISRSLYDQVDGFPDIPLMEDVAISRKLKGQLTPLPITIKTDAERYQKDGWFWRSSKNLWTLTRYIWGASPESLTKRYNR